MLIIGIYNVSYYITEIVIFKWGTYLIDYYACYIGIYFLSIVIF